jgi:hypothetical protein
MTGETLLQLVTYCVKDLELSGPFAQSHTIPQRGAATCVLLTSPYSDALGQGEHIHASIEQMLAHDFSQLELRYLSHLSGTLPSLQIYDDVSSTVADCSPVATSKVLPSRLLTALLSRIVPSSPN